jgi:DUF3048 family protein
MALTQRGKIVVGVIAVALVGLGVLAFTGNAPAPIQDIVDKAIGRPDPCPLTGEPRGGGKDAPARPMLAVKIENTEAAYPLAGLNEADLIYEEPVEGGITRFIALYHCHDTTRGGPVRSARTTDPKILVQYTDEPILVYSGAAVQVTDAVNRADIVSFTETSANDGFTRDDSRSAPHNLYVSTRVLHRIAKTSKVDLSPPDPVFTFDEAVPTPSKRIHAATVTFSSATTAEWAWSDGRWVRHLDGEPMLLEDGEPIVADNVVIQEVVLTESNIIDASGSRSPNVDLTGRGRAWILRDGRRIVGRWSRRSQDDVTVFETKSGDEITLAPGTTFVQLIPEATGEVAFGR